MTSQQQLLNKLKQLTDTVIRYRMLVTLVVAAIVIAYVSQSIAYYAGSEADQERLDQGMTSIKRTKFDEKAIEQIRNLRSNNVDVQPELPTDRVNPF